MNLKRQLLLVSLLTLVLPWAGCEFIRETETALREGQQQMLAGTAQAIADSLAQFHDEFRAFRADGQRVGDQLYAHPLTGEPLLDGYSDDWSAGGAALASLRGVDGPVRFMLGTYRRQLWVYVEVPDANVVYDGTRLADYADRVVLVTSTADGRHAEFRYLAEAPGQLVARREDGGIEARAAAYWQDTPGGYQLEARIPLSLLGRELGLIVYNSDGKASGIRSSSFSSARPGALVMPSPLLQSVLGGYVQRGLRLIVTDSSGWRLATAGDVSGIGNTRPGSGWLRRAYDLILEPGAAAALAEPNPLGREQQPYIAAALDGAPQSSWFRSGETGRAVVAVAQPVWSGNVQTGAVVLQWGTDEILSLTSAALTRLMSFTLIATLVVAGALLGYASWLSQRVRRLSRGARRALDDNRAHAGLPSLAAGDEIGDLSRSFASVLQQIGEYNEYLRTLASKLSHELRTPLTIVRSSLDNLEHEALTTEARQYTERARDGVDRLKKILNAMSEASRVEELMANVDREPFDLDHVLAAAVSAYADAWPQRRFRYRPESADAHMQGAPELIIQMLDKLVDNAVDFSADGDEIDITLADGDGQLLLSVCNPGPPLPERMRRQVFDSMISLREGDGGEHLGLGLFIARLIAEGHGGGIRADNTATGVRFEVSLARA